MSKINAVGKQLESLVQFDATKRVSAAKLLGFEPNDEYYSQVESVSSVVEGNDLNGNQYRFEVSVFDRDGDGRADLVSKRGGQLDSHGNLQKPRTVAELFNKDGFVTAQYVANESGQVVSATVNEVALDNSIAVSRMERSTKENGIVDQRAESTVRRAPIDYFPRSGINLAFDSFYQYTVKQPHLAGQTFVSSDIAGARDSNDDGVLTPDEVFAPSLRLTAEEREDSTKVQAVRERIANGD